MPMFSKRDADRLADAARAAGDDRYPCHSFLSCFVLASALMRRRSHPSSSRPISARSIAMPGALSLRQGDRRNRVPPAARKVSRPRIASSSSVSRQSAEKPGATIATLLRRPLAGKRRRASVGRRLEPFARPKRDWKATIELAAQRLAEQPRGLAAMAMIGIAELAASAAACRGSWRSAPRARNRAPRAAARSGPSARRYRPDRHDKAAASAPPAASASAPARRTPRRSRSRSSPRNIADRAARSGCGRTLPPSAPSSRSAIAGLAVAHRMIDDHAVAERALQRPACRAVIAASGEPSSVHTWL